MILTKVYAAQLIAHVLSLEKVPQRQTTGNAVAVHR